MQRYTIVGLLGIAAAVAVPQPQITDAPAFPSPTTSISGIGGFGSGTIISGADGGVTAGGFLTGSVPYASGGIGGTAYTATTTLGAFGSIQGQAGSYVTGFASGTAGSGGEAGCIGGVISFMGLGYTLCGSVPYFGGGFHFPTGAPEMTAFILKK